MATPARVLESRRSRGAVLLALIVCSSALLLALAQRAEAFVYWTNQTGYSIGRANTSGTGVNQGFITGLGRVVDVVVDDYHIYWTRLGYGEIGRAGLDGTNVNPSFITGCSSPDGLAIYNDHIYWANYTGTIGRAATDGTGVNQVWIDCKATPYNLTQHAGYFYWEWYSPAVSTPFVARMNPTTSSGGTVSHSNILGDYWIHPVYGLCATASHLYWRSDGAIGRASTPYGLSPDRNFITGLEGYGGGLAALDSHLYFTTTGFLEGPANIGRVGTDGSGLNNDFITGCQTPSGVAADDLSAATSVAGVAQQIAGARLPKRLVSRLVQKLRDARAALRGGHPKTALNILDATINEIRAQAGRKIPAATAERWITVLRLIKVHVV
jgi:hypothetical protein